LFNGALARLTEDEVGDGDMRSRSCVIKGLCDRSDEPHQVSRSPLDIMVQPTCGPPPPEGPELPSTDGVCCVRKGRCPTEGWRGGSESGKIMVVCRFNSPSIPSDSSLSSGLRRLPSAADRIPSNGPYLIRTTVLIIRHFDNHLQPTPLSPRLRTTAVIISLRSCGRNHSWGTTLLRHERNRRVRGWVMSPT
jgi:hypothetical protein